LKPSELTAGLDFQQANRSYNIEVSKEGNKYRIALTRKTAAVPKVISWLMLTVQVEYARASAEVARVHRRSKKLSDKKTMKNNIVGPDPARRNRHGQ